MTPLLFLFTLCVIYSGGEDCSYTWEVIEDRTEFENKFSTLQEVYAKGLNPNSVGAFTDTGTKSIYYYDFDMITIVHEIQHVFCELENDNYDDREYCHIRLDMFNIAEKSRNY